MIVNDGLDLIRDWIGNFSVDQPSHMAIGTDNTAASATDTSLGSEVLRKALATSQQGNTGVVTVKMAVLSTEANGQSLKEVGVFNASSGGTMLNRIVHTQIDKTSSFEQRYQIEFTVTGD